MAKQDEQANEVGIVGTVPPPSGGVSVHLARMLDRFSQANLPYRMYDMGGKSDPGRRVVPGNRSPLGFLRFLLTTRHRLIHIHTNKAPALLAALLILPARGKMVAVTLHSEAPMRWHRTAPALVRLWFQRAIRRARLVFCVSEAIGLWIKRLGVADDRVYLAPAFVIPSPGEIAPEQVPSPVRAFLNGHSPVVGTHGWFGYFVDGKHVYGFDMILALVQNLRHRFPHLGCVTHISGVYDPRHREEILQARHEAGLDDVWMIIEEQFPSVAMYRETDLFVRPTATDGDSVSIRECLYLGVPVLASDAVTRPPGCELFASRDQTELNAMAGAMLADADGYRARLSQRTTTDAGDVVTAAISSALR